MNEKPEWVDELLGAIRQLSDKIDRLPKPESQTDTIHRIQLEERTREQLRRVKDDAARRAAWD